MKKVHAILFMLVLVSFTWMSFGLGIRAGTKKGAAAIQELETVHKNVIITTNFELMLNLGNLVSSGSDEDLTEAEYIIRKELQRHISTTGPKNFLIDEDRKREATLLIHKLGLEK